MKALEKLTECKNLLEIHHELLSIAIRKGNQADNRSEIAMTRAFEFGKRSLDAMKMLLHKPELAIFAYTLCRPFYELSKRLLWAAREKDGWQRLVAHYAIEERKWAAEAKELPSGRWPTTIPHARDIYDEKEDVLSRKDSEGKPYEAAPSMPQILSKIVERDISDGLTEESDKIRSEEYTMVYRPMCRAPHAHIVAIGDEVKPDAHLKNSVAAVAIATFALIRAGYFYRGGAETSEIDSAGKQIREIIHSCRNLGFDDSEA